ncbi:MAG: DUF308 domain-containing protein [Bacteroidota bacterium]
MNFINTFKSAIKNWWAILIIGLSLIFLGIMVIRHPLESYFTLSLYFSVALFVTGVSQSFFSISNRDELKAWGWYLAGGLLEVAMGLVLLTHPGLSMVILPIVVGIWLMSRGFSLIGMSTDMRGLGFKNWGWVLFSGILTAMFAFLVIVDPNIGMISIVGWTALAAMLAGGITTYLAFQMKKLGDDFNAVEQEVDKVEDAYTQLKTKITQ